MLSSVLNSERAVQMNMTIMRAFVKLREMIAHNRDIAVRVEKLERSHARTASVIEVLVEDIDRLAGDVKQMKAIPAGTKRKIGFRLGDGERARRIPEGSAGTIWRGDVFAASFFHAVENKSPRRG